MSTNIAEACEHHQNWHHYRRSRSLVFPVDKQQQQQQTTTTNKQQQQLKGVRTHISPRTAAIFRLHLISRTFSYLHLISTTFFYQNDTFFKEIQEFTIDSNPKGVNQAPSIRIRCRHIFRVFSTSYEFFKKNHQFFKNFINFLKNPSTFFKNPSIF